MKTELKITDLETTLYNLSQLRECEIVPVGLSEGAREKLEYLRSSGRDFFAVTPTMNQYVTQSYSQVRTFVLSGQRLSVEQLMVPVSVAVGSIIFDRFGRDDVGFKPLKQSTLRYKQKHGYPAAIGVANGELKREMQTIKWKAKP